MARLPECVAPADTGDGERYEVRGRGARPDGERFQLKRRLQTVKDATGWLDSLWLPTRIRATKRWWTDRSRIEVANRSMLTAMRISPASHVDTARLQIRPVSRDGVPHVEIDALLTHAQRNQRGVLRVLVVTGKQ